MKYLMVTVSSGDITIALIPSESRETKLEMTRMDGVRVQRATTTVTATRTAIKLKV